MVTLDVTINDVSNHIFPECSVRMQKHWMCRQLCKPHDMSIRTYVARVVEINDQIPSYPHLDDEGPASKLNKDELMDILEFGIPNSWQKQMILHNFDLIQKLMTEFIQFCKRIKKTEDKVVHVLDLNEGKESTKPKTDLVKTTEAIKNIEVNLDTAISFEIKHPLKNKSPY